MKKLLTSAILITSIFTQANAMTSSECKEFKDLAIYKGEFTVKDAYTITKAKKAMLIDIRSIQAHEKLRPKGSISVPLVKRINGKRVFIKNFISNLKNKLNGNMKQHFLVIDSTELLSTCLSNYLADKGFDNVYKVKVGFDNKKNKRDWLGYRLPTEKGKISSSEKPKQIKKEEPKKAINKLPEEEKKVEAKPKRGYLSIYEKIANEKAKKDNEAKDDLSKIEAERNKNKDTSLINSVITKLP